jgi:apolipoprotein N-acyltransferase
MRQHLANVIFRAVENGRPLLRVTNTGLSALIEPDGDIQDQTEGFRTDVRNWSVRDEGVRTTFYTKHGDLFVYVCAAITLLIVILGTGFRRILSND